MVFICLCTVVQAQQCNWVAFDYDAAGNRIKRSIVVEPCAIEEPQNARMAVVKKDTTIDGNVKINENALLNSLTLYPNPTNKGITVESKGWEVQAVQILNTEGKVLQSAKVQGYTVSLDIADFNTGIYMVQVWLGDGKYKTFKVQKQ